MVAFLFPFKYSILLRSMNHASALSNLEEVGHGHPQTQVQAAHDST